MKTITIPLKQAESLQEFRHESGARKIGLLYFELLPDGGTISRTITAETDAVRLQKQLKAKLIYLPEEMIINELS